ncbi:MAG: hypothetical protein ABH884_00100 [Candidatus Komeilibacteria bacterium]
MKQFTEIIGGRSVIIEFDVEPFELIGDPEDPRNTPEKLIERCKASLMILADLANADRVVFTEQIKGEQYKIVKEGETFILTANPDPEGAWLNIVRSTSKVEIEMASQSDQEILEEVALRR